jgi:hypothetical protein
MYNVLAFMVIICIPIVLYMSQIEVNEPLNRELIGYKTSLALTFFGVFSVILFFANFSNLKIIDRESFYSIATI